MNRGSPVRLSGPHVVAEEIEGEVIAVNLDTGAYYSFRDSASVVWQQLLAGEGRPGAIVDELSARFIGTREEIERAVFVFLRTIEDEGLIAPPEISPGFASRDGDPPPSQAVRSPFRAPVFEKYTDMQEFLLVDPIHEVDVSDWPSVTPQERR